MTPPAWRRASPYQRALAVHVASASPSRSDEKLSWRVALPLIALLGVIGWIAGLGVAVIAFGWVL